MAAGEQLLMLSSIGETWYRWCMLRTRFRCCLIGFGPPLATLILWNLLMSWCPWVLMEHRLPIADAERIVRAIEEGTIREHRPGCAEVPLHLAGRLQYHYVNLTRRPNGLLLVYFPTYTWTMRRGYIWASRALGPADLASGSGPPGLQIEVGEPSPARMRIVRGLPGRWLYCVGRYRR